jgi:hypothetical protein
MSVGRQSKSDTLNLPTFRSQLEQREDHLEETPEWMVLAPLAHRLFQSTEPQDQLKAVITKGKTLNCKTLTCLWKTMAKNAEERQAVPMKEWLNHIGGWKTMSGQIRNEQHDGCVEGRSACLIAANRESINKLPEQFAESNDWCHCLEQTPDVGDGTFKDCFTSFATSNNFSKPSGTGASIKMTLTVQQIKRKTSTFSTLRELAQHWQVTAEMIACSRTSLHRMDFQNW